MKEQLQDISRKKNKKPQKGLMQLSPNYVKRKTKNQKPKNIST